MKSCIAWRSTAVLLLPYLCSAASTPNVYQSHAEEALGALQSFYSNSTGLWSPSANGTWWHSGNALTTLANMVLQGSSPAKEVTQHVFPNTYTQAPRHSPEKTGNFSDGFYDDDAWWAMGWIRTYDATKDDKYLEIAKTLFEDTTAGWPSKCSGLWWNKKHSQVNSIANNLFLEVAAYLANRVPDKKSCYVGWAEKEWSWYVESGLYSTTQHYVLEGKLDLDTCKSTAQDNRIGDTNTQGSLISGLTELAAATGNSSYLTEAKLIAEACMKSSVMTVDGILTEPYVNMAVPQHDACERKGAFMRGLMRLYQSVPDAAYRAYAEQNAQSIWRNDRKNGTYLLGQDWSHYYDIVDACSQSSALDGLVAAWSLSS